MNGFHSLLRRVDARGVRRHLQYVTHIATLRVRGPIFEKS